VDRAIRVSTAVAVLAVAGVAAYVSYWHAYAVVCAHGKTGVTVRLEPATIDGLVYASSMVNLYAARHRLPVPALVRWLLALGIIATLAADMTQGWSHGTSRRRHRGLARGQPRGQLRAAGLYHPDRSGRRPGPRVSRGPRRTAGRAQADHHGTCFHLAAAQVPDAGREDLNGQDTGLTLSGGDGQIPVARMASAGHASGPPWSAADQADQMSDHPGRPSGFPGLVATASPNGDLNAAAVAAYRASVRMGKPLSERKLAEQFGKTSRRWARNRMAEARESQHRSNAVHTTP